MPLPLNSRLPSHAPTACVAFALVLASLYPLATRAQASVTEEPASLPEGSAPPPILAVGAQYCTTHVYVAPSDLDAFVSSFTATFGGSATKPGTTTVTPTPSRTLWRAVRTPVGLLSVFAFQTPIPWPFGEERTGYMVSNMDRAIEAAHDDGAEVIVAPFKDAIGVDAILQWPGGVRMQIYSHFNFTMSPPLETVPDNRVYLSPDTADNFVRGFVEFSAGRVLSDDHHADAGEIGRPGETYRRIRIRSGFGNMQVMVTDGHLPYPFGRETTGYEVRDLNATLAKAKAAGVKILSPPYTSGGRTSAILEFPGGYIAEVHSSSTR
ncbi:MAG: glyoxalase [Terracidiphilus sp.]